MCYYLDDIVKDININFSNILVDKKLYENILVYEKLYKNHWSWINGYMDQKLLHVGFDKIGGFIKVLVGNLDIQYYLIMDCLIKFVIRLNIL